MLLYLLLFGFLVALVAAYCVWDKHAIALHQITLLQQDLISLQRKIEEGHQQSSDIKDVTTVQIPDFTALWQQSLNPLNCKIAKITEIAHRTTGQNVRMQTCLQYARKGVQQLDKSFVMGQKIMENMVSDAVMLDPKTRLAKNALHIEAIMTMQAEYIKILIHGLDELSQQSSQTGALLRQLSDAAVHHQQALKQIADESNSTIALMKDLQKISINREDYRNISNF